MKLKRFLLMLLIFCAACLVTADLYFIFFYQPPAKKPQEYSPIVIGGTDYEEQHSEWEAQTNDPHIEAGSSIESDIYVRDIPIPLDSQMQDHLALFRSKAKLLNQEFPDSFLISMKGSEKTIALTFDDGPDLSSTAEVVEILNNYKIPGTFFLLGQQMARYPETINLILEGGHVIANHSWSHIRPTEASLEELMAEIDKTQQEIAKYGVSTKLFRPPYGLVDRTQMPALIDAGYDVICWSIDSMDWYFDKAEQIVECVVSNAHPGAVVLMHSAGGRDNRKAAIEALPVIIETLLDEGYRFVKLGE
ncbi:MAG TPA: polysaccharide deacetylase family protein [Clostridiales bacterium]|nr:polysaccharide deacetylase family protein [Clostridiales bacterium]